MITYTGLKFWPCDPWSTEVCVKDIAHHLSLQCRYAGAVERHCSVAEHCVNISRVVPPQYAAYGLLHDAPEAYVGDLLNPIKHQPELVGFVDIEARVQKAINARFRLVWTDEIVEIIKDVDDRIVLDETAALSSKPEEYIERVPGKAPLGIKVYGWPWEAAEMMFMQRYRELFPSGECCQNHERH